MGGSDASAGDDGCSGPGFAGLTLEHGLSLYIHRPANTPAIGNIQGHNNRLVTGTLLVQIKLEPIRPAYFRGVLPGSLKLKPTVSGRQRLYGKFAGASGELDASGGRGEQLHAITLLLEILVNMTPEYDFHLRVPVDHLPESIAVLQADFFHPVRANIHRVMVQAHHGGQLRLLRQ